MAAFCFLPSAYSQTIPHVTGTFKTPENKTPPAAGLRTLATINSVAVYGSVDFVPTNTASNTPTRLLYGGITYPPQPVRAWIKADGTLVDDYTAAAGVDLVPTVGATPSGLALCANIRFAASSDGFTPAVSWTECKELPASASVDWGTLPVATITTPAQSYQLTSGGTISDYENYLGIAAPANPPSGYARWYFNTNTSLMACLTSAGANCSPSGGGGGTPCVVTANSLQYNNAGAFGCLTPFTYNSGTSTQTVGNGGTFTYSGSGSINARKVNNTEFTNAESLGKIPIGQGNGTAVWSDPLVQGTYAPGTNTSTGGLSGGAINPVLVGGSDYAGTPLLRNLKVDSSGQLYLGNASIPVTGTFWQATQPVSGTVAATQSGAWSLSANQSVNVAQINGVTPLMGAGNTGTGSPRVTIASDQAAIPVTGTFWQATQPVSGTVAATQSGAWSLTANQSVNVAQINGITPLMGAGNTGTGSPRVTIASDQAAIPVTGTFWQATQPVSGTFWQATQPVSGTVTANQGGAPWSDNLTQLNGNTLLAGNGITGTGSPRVTIASDQTAFGVNVSNIPHTICDSGCAGGALSNNTAAPSNNNGGVLGYIANAVAPSYSEGNQVLGSVDLNGIQRINCAIGCTGSAGAATVAAQNIQTTYLTELATPIFPHAANGASGPNAWASPAVTLTGCEYSGMLPNLLSGQAVPCQIDRFGRALVSIGASVPIQAIQTDASGVKQVYDACQSNSKSFFSFSLTSNTQILTGVAAKKFHFCGWNDQNGGTAQNYAVVEGTGSTCATGIAAVGGLSGGTTAAGGWNTGANGGRFSVPGIEFAGTSVAGDNVCILISGSTQLSGGGAYVLAQ